MSHTGLGLYFTYEARLASFQKITKKRGSTTGGKAAKALNWPHKQISPVSLARAGFVFRPSPESPDNTVCFLCEKGLDGWEAGDDPIYEHVKHAPHCGWAVVAAIEADLGVYGKEDPNHPDMVEARKATFAGLWPHDSKKGWKCKTKQLVEAGWKYTPTSDSDDMATCTYCQLALDGWEANDKPFDEHYNRSPDCQFFSLVNQYKAMAKPFGHGRQSRASKVSRLSGQSVATLASDTTAVGDVTTGPDDSVMTTTSTATQQGTKKPRGRKAAAPKGGRKKAKKEEQVEIQEASQQFDEAAAQPLPEQPPKAKRGRMRTNEAAQEADQQTQREAASLASLEQPPKAKRGRKRISDKVPEVEHEVDEVEVASRPSLEQPSKAKRGKKRISDTVQDDIEEERMSQPSPQQPPKAKRGRKQTSEADQETSHQVTKEVVSQPLSPQPHRAKPGRKKTSEVVREASHEVEEEVAPRASPQPAPAEKRGKKRSSQVMKESILEKEQGPSLKKRATFSPKANNPDGRVMVHEDDTAMSDASPLKVLQEEDFPDDDEIERQLEADLIGYHSDTAETRSAQALPRPSSARHQVLSPSKSPQSSDAENQPPTGRGKRNAMAGLRSTTPWTAADVDNIFGSPWKNPGKERGVDAFLKMGKELTGPEKRMTVEEWIYYNAAEAEKSLKYECELMVSRFEKEGTRAMKVLEGLEV